MIIKGRIFGTEKPIICVPIIEQTTEEILAAVQKMAERKAEMIEWRMDWYEAISDENAVKELLEKISGYLEHTVLLCTYRSKQQGGEGQITQEEYLALNRMLAATGVPDLIDLEYYEMHRPQQVIAELKQMGVKVVCSNHDFKKTPVVEDMQQQLSTMVEAGADFAKLAVMPKKKTDVLHLMEAVLRVKEKYPDSHLIAMSMGKKGVISRLLGGWYYSEVTFAAFEKASAPGQISCQTVADIQGKIEECIL